MKAINLCKNIGVFLISSAMIFLNACTQDNNQAANAIAPSSAHIAISFDYEKQSGYASNQFAVWIEDTDGNLVRTIYATRYTVSTGHRNRPDAIPLWVSRAEPSAMDKDYIDALSGATPGTGRLDYFWDLRDQNGQIVPNGEYRYYIEGTLRWSNRVLFSGEVIIDDNVTIKKADAEYTFEGSNNRPALTETSTEVKMISSVLVEYRNAGK